MKMSVKGFLENIEQFRIFMLISNYASSCYVTADFRSTIKSNNIYTLFVSFCGIIYSHAKV